MPEYNIIQRPELLLALARRLGLRQAHIAPTLNEGVQAVVVLDDLREKRAPEATPVRFYTLASMVPVVAVNPWLGIYCRNNADLAALGLRAKENPIILQRVIFSSTQLGGAAQGSLLITVEPGKFVGAPAGGADPPLGWDERRAFTSETAETRSQAGLAFGPGGNPRLVATMLTNNRAEFMFGPEYEVPPGYTLWLWSDTNNFDLDINVEFDQQLLRET